uniref:Uncharacterized protein n=1 Tax=Trypanosoma vivax (strain Y486) TaxID=1055687 RepID=G0U0U8_TRYVY|nr:conserved hypothetical protein, fragment [Trypanosoma vivax Y486]
MNETSLTNDLSGRIEGYGDLLDENGIFDAEYRARRFDTEYERSIGTGVSKQVLLHGYRDQESRVRQLDALAELQRKIPERVETGHALVVSANVLTLAIMSSHLFMHRWIVEEAQTLDDAVMTLRKQVDNARSSGYRVSGHEDPKSSPARRGTKVKVKCDDTTNVTSNSEDVMGLDATHDHVAAVAGERAAVHRPPADMAGSFFSGRHKRCGMGRPAPPEMLARLVIVDTFTHEPFYEIAEHLRQIDREYNIGLVIILLMYESFADRAPGMVVLPQHTTSPSEAYNFGFDLVLRRCCDHNTIAFLNELFVSAAGRCRTDIRRQLLMGNFNVIKELLESTARVSPGLRHEMTDLDDSFGANAEFGEPNTFAGKVSHDASSVLSETTGSFMATVDAIKEHKYSSVLMRMGFSKDTVAELMNPSNKVKYIGRRRMQSGNVKKRTFSAHGNLNSTLGGLSMADDDDTYEEIIMDEMQEVESAVVSAYRDEVARLILDRDRKERAIDFLKDENEKLHRFLQILPRSPSLSGSTRKLMDTGHKTGTPCDEKSSGTSGSPLFDVGESGIIQRQASADKTLSSYNSLGVSALRFDLAPEAPPVTEVSVASCHTTKSLTTKSVSSPILAKQLTGQDVSTSAWKARQHDPPLVERKGSFSSSSGSSVPYASSAFTASPDCKKQTQLRRDMAPLPLDSSPLERERRVQQVEQLQFSMQSTSCSPHRAVVSGDRVQHCETGVAVSEYSGLLDGTYMGTHSALVCFLQALRETYSQLEHVIREELVPLESRIASEISEKNQGANKGDGLQISAELLMHLDATLLLRLASRLRSSCAAVPDVASGNLSDNALSYIGNFPGDPTPPLRTGPSSASEGARDGDVVSTSLRERNTDSSLGLSAKDVTRLLVELNVEEEEVPKTLMNILATADDEEQFFDYETTSRVISELARLEETKKQRIDRTMKRLEERREQMKRELGLGDAGPVRNDPVNHSDTENKTTANMVTKSAQQVALLDRFNMLKSKRPVASDINNPLLHVIKNRAQTVISTTAMHIVAPELSMRCIDMTSSQPFGASDMALVDGLPPVQIRGLSLEQQRKLRGLMKKHPQEILNANIPELQVRSYFATQDKQEVPSPTEIEVPTEVPSSPREVVLSPIELAKRLLFYRTVLQNRSMEEESLERLRIQPHFSLPIFPKACPRAEKGYRDSPLPGVVDNPVEYTSWLYNVPNLELRPTLSYATGGDMSVVFVPKESDHDMTPRTAVGWSRRMEYIFPRRMLARMDMYSSPATLAAQRLGEQLQLTMSDLRTGVVGRPMTLFTSRATQPRSPLSPLKKAQYQGVEPPSIGDDVEAQSARSSSAHELQDTLPWT